MFRRILYWLDNLSNHLPDITLHKQACPPLSLPGRHNQPNQSIKLPGRAPVYRPASEQCSAGTALLTVQTAKILQHHNKLPIPDHNPGALWPALLRLK